MHTEKGLEIPDRFRLMDELHDSIAPADWPRPSDEWMAEVQRRSSEFDAGRMPGSSWSEVRERARQKAGLNG